MNEPVAAIPQQPEKPRKDNTWKWLFLGCFGFILLFGGIGGIIGWRAYKSFSMKPEDVEIAAQQILTFEKPEDYEGKFSMSIMGITMASLAPKGPTRAETGGMILLMTMPQNNRDAMRKQMDSQVETSRNGRNVTTQKLAEQTFKVRGEAVPAEVQKVTPDQGEVTLQYTLFLMSPKKQLVMLNLTGPEKTTTHDWVQKFLDTVK